MNKRQAKKKRKKSKAQLIFPMTPEEHEECLKAKMRVVYTPRQLIVGTFDNKHWMKEYFKQEEVKPPIFKWWRADEIILDDLIDLKVLERIEDGTLDK